MIEADLIQLLNIDYGKAVAACEQLGREVTTPAGLCQKQIRRQSDTAFDGEMPDKHSVGETRIDDRGGDPLVGRLNSS